MSSHFPLTPAGPVPSSLFRLGLAARLLIVTGLSAVIWGAVLWAGV